MLSLISPLAYITINKYVENNLDEWNYHIVHFFLQ